MVTICKGGGEPTLQREHKARGGDPQAGKGLVSLLIRNLNFFEGGEKRFEP